MSLRVANGLLALLSFRLIKLLNLLRHFQRQRNDSLLLFFCEDPSIKHRFNLGQVCNRLISFLLLHIVLLFDGNDLLNEVLREVVDVEI